MLYVLYIIVINPYEVRKITKIALIKAFVFRNNLPLEISGRKPGKFTLLNILNIKVNMLS